MDAIARTRVTLRQLEAFRAVCLAGTVSAAATRLARTQSAVSLALHELEAALGVRLFERVGRGLRQTDAARRLLPRATELVDRAAELPAVAGDPTAGARHLAIGATRSIGPYWMPELLSDFARARPGVAIELVVANTGVLLSRVRDLSLAFAFIEGEVLEPGLGVRRWIDDEMCLFARAQHPRPADLRGAQWALRERGSGTRETFLRAMQPLIGAPAIGVEVDDPEALKRLVAAGDWFGCLSRRSVQAELRAGTLRDVTPASRKLRRALTRTFWIVSHPARYRSSLADALLDCAGAASPRASAARASPARASSATPG